MSCETTDRGTFTVMFRSDQGKPWTPIRTVKNFTEATSVIADVCRSGDYWIRDDRRAERLAN